MTAVLFLMFLSTYYKQLAKIIIISLSLSSTESVSQGPLACSHLKYPYLTPHQK